MNKFPFEVYEPVKFSDNEMRIRASGFFQFMNRRRSVRHFSTRLVDEEIIGNIIRTAGTAPSGAHKQPWSFCVVTRAELKKEIREAAEHEERINYTGRMSEEWMRDLAPLGTDADKEFLETAPVLIVVFRRLYELEPNNHKHCNYYVNESTGIACGLLIAAIHNAGLVCLTHTPSPMNFLEKILKRPVNERAFLLIPVGYAACEVQVPKLERKALHEIMFHYD